MKHGVLKDQLDKLDRQDEAAAAESALIAEEWEVVDHAEAEEDLVSAPRQHEKEE